MNKRLVAVCPKCKKSVVKLYEKGVRIMYACENCKFELDFTGHKNIKELWAIQKFHNKILSVWFVKGEFTAENLRDVKIEEFANYLEASNEV